MYQDDNIYWQEWYDHAQLIFPNIVPEARYDANGDIEGFTDADVDEVYTAVKTTSRAIAMGVGLAAIDGPLPIMDVIAFGVVVVISVHAWWKVFD